ncbi:MAG TPA: RICIN domain-containing protein [Polyangia bacterium]|nr:RICIN domain-containing protein [Polyangia bacterium]
MRPDHGSRNLQGWRSAHGWTALGLCLVAASCGAPPDSGSSAGSSTTGTSNIEQTRSALLAECPEDPNSCNISGSQAVSSGAAQAKQLLTYTKDIVNEVGDVFAADPNYAKDGTDIISLLQDFFFSPSSPNIEGDLTCLSYEVACVAQGLDWEIRESTWESDWGEVNQALKDMPSGFTTGSADDHDSAVATQNAGLPLTFSRLFVQSATDGDGNWKKTITNSAPESMGTDAAGKAISFDWQAGFTRFMALIPQRLAIIGYLDPTFQADRLRSLEIDGTDGYRPTLQNWLNNWMLPGVRCDTKDRILPHYNNNSEGYDYYYYDHTDVACADVNSGLSQETTYVIPNYNSCITNHCTNGQTTPGGVECFGGQNHPLSDHYTVDSTCTANLPGQSSVPPMEDTLRREVLLELPGFEVHSAIDGLYRITHPQPDLTQTAGRIALSANTGLCLDVPNASSTPGTAVQLWYCNGGAAQQWHYDRTAQTITNTASGMCLQARPDSNGFDFGDFYPGNPVEISECLGGGTNPPPARQLWTYDPEKGIIRNGLGTVLDVKWNNEQAGTTVWLWDENDGPSQQWYADGPVPFYDGSTGCTVGGTSMHCCPTGSAMVGARLDQNVFKCAWLRDGTGAISLDVGTQRNGMHTCPLGSVMVGYHQDLDQLACQQIPGNPISSERIDYGTEDDYPMHVCDTSFLNEAMSGVSPSQNLLTCATDPILR